MKKIVSIMLIFLLMALTCALAEDAERVEQVDLETVTLLGTGTQYEQYLDDGQTKEYGEEHIRVLTK